MRPHASQLLSAALCTQASPPSATATDPEQLSRLMAALDDIDRLGVEGAQKVSSLMGMEGA